MTIIWVLIGTALVIGTLVVARLAAKRRELRRPRPIRLPEGLNLYAGNAFQVLGINPVQSTTRLILRRRDDIQVLLEAELPVRDGLPEYQAVSWPWAPMPTLEALNRAVGRIQSEPSRLEEEVFWFHLDREPVEVVAPLTAGDVAAARSAWETRLRANGSPYQKAQAQHNLAVLAHAEILEKERRHAETGVHDAEHLAAWGRVLNQWGDVYANDNCWTYFDRRRAAAADPLVDQSFCRRLRAGMPERLLRIHAQLARAAIAAGNREYARGHIDLIRASRFSRDLIDAILAQVFEPQVLEMRAAFRPLFDAKQKLDSGVDLRPMRATVRKVRQQLQNFDAEPAVSPVSVEIITAVRKPAMAELKGSLDSGLEADFMLWKMMDFAIAAWNAASSRYEHRSACDLLGEFKAKVTELDKKVTETDGKARAAKALLGLLEELCVQGTEHLQKELKDDLEATTKRMAKLRTEVGKTRERFNRNYSGMRQELGI